MKPLIKSNNRYIIFCLALIFVVSCREDVSAPSFEDETLAIYFPNLQGEQFRSMNRFEGKEFDRKYTKYLSKGDKPNLVITKEFTRFDYEQLQMGRRDVCPPDFLSSFAKEVIAVPTHTELLNDTTFLLGSLWYESSEISKNNFKTNGSIGWQASILQPSSTTYINLWHESSDITLDSLMNWSLKMREGIIITLVER